MSECAGHPQDDDEPLGLDSECFSWPASRPITYRCRCTLGPLHRRAPWIERLRQQMIHPN